MIRIALCFLIALSGNAAAAILYTNANETELNTSSSNTFDSATINRLNDDCVREPPQSYTPGANQHIRRVTSPVRAGTYAQVQLLQKGCDYRPANSDLKQKPRTGMQIKRATVDAHSTTADKRERWVTFSFYLPEDYEFETSATPVENFFQLFKEDSRDYQANAFNVTLIRDDLQLKSNNASANGQTGIIYQLDNISKNVWYDITLHFKLQEPGGSGGFFEWYINYPGYATPTIPVSTNTDAGTTVNTETGAGQHGFEFNFYKYAGYCTSEYQLNATACPYDAAGGYPKATNTSTVWSGQRKVYFDEVRIGDSTSSLAEVAPHIGDDPVDTGIDIVSMNVGEPLTENADPVYFTATGSDTALGVREIEVCKTGSATECDLMPAMNSNVTGGRFTANDFPTITGDGSIPVTVTMTYDNTAQVDSEYDLFTDIPVSWTNSNITAPVSFLSTEYGYTKGAAICNATSAQGFLISKSLTVTSGQQLFAQVAVKRTGTQDLSVKFHNGTTAAVASGTLGGGGTFAVTSTNTGTAHAVTRESTGDVDYITFSMNANTTSTHKVRIGPNSTTSGHCANVLGVRTWVAPDSDTMNFETTLSRADVTPPELTDCQISAVSTSVMNLGCLLSENTGTFYAVITSSATAPSLAQIKAGQNNLGTAAVWSSSQAATSNTFTSAALNPYIDKYAYFALTDGAANDSVVATAEAPIVGEPPVTKSIVWNGTLTRAGVPYSTPTDPADPVDHIKVYDKNPLADPTAVLLAHAQNVVITGGSLTLTEASLVSRSINALEPATDYWWFLFDIDKDPFAFGTIQITVE